jgi:hypothetical protein
MRCIDLPPIRAQPWPRQGCTPSRDLPRAPAISHERPRKRGSKSQLAIGNWPRSQAGCRSNALPGGAVLVLADSQQPIANRGYVPDVGVSRQEPALSRQNARQNDGPAEDLSEVQQARTGPAYCQASATPRPATSSLPPISNCLSGRSRVYPQVLPRTTPPLVAG